MDEGPLGVHQVELVVQPGPCLHDGGGVGEAADRPVHLGQVSPRHHGGRLVVDADLEAGGTPVHKLDGLLGLHICNGGVDILGDHVSSVEETDCHVLAILRVTLHHLVLCLETGFGDHIHAQSLFNMKVILALVTKSDDTSW